MLPIFLLAQFSICLAAEPIKLTSTFNAKEIEWVKTAGNSSVSGSAEIRLENGETKGCASFNVELLPVASYSNERIKLTYGNNKGGQILLSQNPPKFNPDVKAYHEMLISTTCNTKNEFIFTNIPKGDFYLIAFIMWDENKDGAPIPSGGAVMKRIVVTENSAIKVDL